MSATKCGNDFGFGFVCAVAGIFSKKLQCHPFLLHFLSGKVFSLLCKTTPLSGAELNQFVESSFVKIIFKKK